MKKSLKSRQITAYPVNTQWQNIFSKWYFRVFEMFFGIVCHKHTYEWSVCPSDGYNLELSWNDDLMAVSFWWFRIFINCYLILKSSWFVDLQLYSPTTTPSSKLQASVCNLASFSTTPCARGGVLSAHNVLASCRRSTRMSAGHVESCVRIRLRDWHVMMKTLYAIDNYT